MKHDYFEKHDLYANLEALYQPVQRKVIEDKNVEKKLKGPARQMEWNLQQNIFKHLIQVGGCRFGLVNFQLNVPQNVVGQHIVDRRYRCGHTKNEDKR
jgi:hypothetical protein